MNRRAQNRHAPLTDLSIIYYIFGSLGLPVMRLLETYAYPCGVSIVLTMNIAIVICSTSRGLYFRPWYYKSTIPF